MRGIFGSSSRRLLRLDCGARNICLGSIGFTITRQTDNKEQQPSSGIDTILNSGLHVLFPQHKNCERNGENANPAQNPQPCLSARTLACCVGVPGKTAILAQSNSSIYGLAYRLTSSVSTDNVLVRTSLRRGSDPFSFECDIGAAALRAAANLGLFLGHFAATIFAEFALRFCTAAGTLHKHFLQLVLNLIYYSTV